MKLERVIVAGVVGGCAVLLIVWAGGLLAHADGDLVGLSAAALFARAGWIAWVGGLIAQLVVAVAAAIAYAIVFEWVTRRANALIGLAVALPHVIIAGLVVGFLPASRLIAGDVMPPGAFYEFRGAWCIAAFVAAHLAFGVLVGAMYGRTRHTMPTVTYRFVEVAQP